MELCLLLLQGAHVSRHALHGEKRRGLGACDLSFAAAAANATIDQYFSGAN